MMESAARCQSYSMFKSRSKNDATSNCWEDLDHTKWDRREKQKILSVANLSNGMKNNMHVFNHKHPAAPIDFCSDVDNDETNQEREESKNQVDVKETSNDYTLPADILLERYSKGSSTNSNYTGTESSGCSITGGEKETQSAFSSAQPKYSLKNELHFDCLVGVKQISHDYTLPDNIILERYSKGSSTNSSNYTGAGNSSYIGGGADYSCDDVEDPYLQFDHQREQQDRTILQFSGQGVAILLEKFSSFVSTSSKRLSVGLDSTTSAGRCRNEDQVKVEISKMTNESAQAIISCKELWEELQNDMKSSRSVTNAAVHGALRRFIAKRRRKDFDNLRLDHAAVSKEKAPTMFNKVSSAATVDGTSRHTAATTTHASDLLVTAAGHRKCLIGRRNSLYGVASDDKNLENGTTEINNNGKPMIDTECCCNSNLSAKSLKCIRSDKDSDDLSSRGAQRDYGDSDDEYDFTTYQDIYYETDDDDDDLCEDFSTQWMQQRSLRFNANTPSTSNNNRACCRSSDTLTDNCVRDAECSDYSEDSSVEYEIRV